MHRSRRASRQPSRPAACPGRCRRRRPGRSSLERSRSGRRRRGRRCRRFQMRPRLRARSAADRRTGHAWPPAPTRPRLDSRVRCPGRARSRSFRDSSRSPTCSGPCARAARRSGRFRKSGARPRWCGRSGLHVLPTDARLAPKPRPFPERPPTRPARATPKATRGERPAARSPPYLTLRPLSVTRSSRVRY